MRTLILMLAAATTLAACDRSASDKTMSKIERAKGADPVVMAKRRAAGRWRSEPGILPGDKTLWVILDVAGTQDLRIERRGLSGRYESVYSSASGKIEITSEGISGEAPDADGSLLPFRTFTATFPSAAKMLVKSGDRTFVFRFDGL